MRGLVNQASGVVISGQSEINTRLLGTVVKGDAVILHNEANMDTPVSHSVYNIGGLGLTFSTNAKFAMSADGKFAVSCGGTTYVYFLKRAVDQWVVLPRVDTIPALGAEQCVAISPDGTYVALGLTNTPYHKLYKRTGDQYNEITGLNVTPPNQLKYMAFSYDGTYLALATVSTPFLSFYKRSGDTFTKLTTNAPNTQPAIDTYCISWSADSTYVSVGCGGSPWVVIYKRTGDTFIKLTSNAPVLQPAGSVYHMDMTKDGNYMVHSQSASPYVYFYKRTGDTWTRLTASAPDVSIGGACTSCQFSKDGNYCVLGSGVSPYIYVYKRSGDTWIKRANPTTLPSSAFASARFTPLGDLLFGGFSATFLAYKGTETGVVLSQKSINTLLDAKDAIGSGYAKEAGVLGDTKKTIKIWG